MPLSAPAVTHDKTLIMIPKTLPEEARNLVMNCKHGRGALIINQLCREQLGKRSWSNLKRLRELMLSIRPILYEIVGAARQNWEHQCFWFVHNLIVTKSAEPAHKGYHQFLVTTKWRLLISMMIGYWLANRLLQQETWAKWVFLSVLKEQLHLNYILVSHCYHTHRTESVPPHASVNK